MHRGEDFGLQRTSLYHDVVVIHVDGASAHPHIAELERLGLVTHVIGAGVTPLRVSARAVMLLLAEWDPAAANLLQATARACKASNATLIVAATRLDRALLSACCNENVAMVVEAADGRSRFIARRVDTLLRRLGWARSR